MNNDTLQKVTKIVSEVLEKDEKLCLPATPLKDLGADEFDMIELVMKLEDQFSVLIDDDQTEQISTIQSAADLITHHKSQK